MKKLLLLLLFTSISFGQTTLANKLKITANVTDNTAAKVNVQTADGFVNTIAKIDLQDALTFANEASFPVVGIAGKLYLASSSPTKLYRWNGTVYNEVGSGSTVTDATPTVKGIVKLAGDLGGTADLPTVPNKVDKVAGQGLISNVEKTRLSTVVNYDNSGNVTALNSKLNGNGTTNFLPKFSNSNTLQNSNISEIGNEVIFNGMRPITINQTTGAINFKAPGLGGWVLGNFYNNNNNIISGGFGIYGEVLNPLYHFIGADYLNPLLKIESNGNVTSSGSLIATSNNGIPNAVVRNSDIANKANLASPNLTGIPTAPTAPIGTNTTQIATTAFVTNADAGNVKLVGDQNIFGKKTFTNSSNGISINVNNSGANPGVLISNTANGTGLGILNQLNGAGLICENQNSGNGIVSNGNVSSTGFVFAGQNNGLRTFTVNKEGDTVVAKLNVNQILNLANVPIFSSALLANSSSLVMGDVYQVNGVLMIIQPK